MSDSQALQDDKAGDVSSDPRAAFGIADPRTIGRHLMQSVQHKDLYIIIHRGDQFITCLLDVDVQAGTLTFDTSQIPEKNLALIAASGSQLQGRSGGVGVEFELSDMQIGEFGGEPALVAQLPAVLYYMQRRGFFRINTPIVNPFRCMGRMVLPQGGERAFDLEVHSVSYDVEVRDISLSGIGLRSPDSMEIGTQLPGSQINMRDYGALQTNLRVVNCQVVELEHSRKLHLIGCIFEGLTIAQEAMLQRYIMQAEKSAVMRV